MSSISNLKILYVEDDKFAREEMSHFLKKRVGKVFTAADGIEGIGAYEIHRPDIIIADLLMPNMDGMEMLRQLREKYGKVHCIIVTSVNEVETVIEAVDMGVDGYIVKPIDFMELELKLIKTGDMLAEDAEACSGPFERIDNKRIAEDSIKREYVKVLKSFTGKGPRETVVQIMSDQVKITSFGALTPMETNMLKEPKNFEMIKHMRTVAYETMASDFSDVIKTHTGVDTVMSEVKIDLKRGVEQVTMCI